jgi:microcystin-dependent protein
MSDPYVGEIRNFGFYFVPSGWALCNGQLLSVNEYDALFSLLGTIYGGDGHTTFGLPDLRGRVSIHEGMGPGLTNYHLGQKAGAERVILDEANLPAHTHNLKASTLESDTDVPTAGVLANARSNTYLKPTSPNPGPFAQLNDGSVSASGSGLDMENHQPYLATNYCIALTGIYPST